MKELKHSLVGRRPGPHQSYYEGRNVSVCVFVLCCLQAGGHQTRQEGQSWAQMSLMAGNATFLSVCAVESPAGNPIGSALVFSNPVKSTL